MEADLVKGAVGSVGKYDVAFKEGKLVIEVDAEVGVGTAGLVIKLDAVHVMDALSQAIPGALDDAVFAIIKNALVK